MMSNRLLNEGVNKGFYGRCELIADSESLTETRPSEATVRNWSAVERIVVVPLHLFIDTSGIFVVTGRSRWEKALRPRE